LLFSQAWFDSSFNSYEVGLSTFGEIGGLLDLSELYVNESIFLSLSDSWVWSTFMAIFDSFTELFLKGASSGY